MSFRSKMMAALAVVGLAPLFLMAVVSLRASRHELSATVEAAQRQRVTALVKEVVRVTEDLAAYLAATVGYIPFDTLTPSEAAEVLRIPYRQFSVVTIVGLFDETGQAVVPPVFRRPEQTGGEVDEHEPVFPEDLEIFSRNVPSLASIEATGAAVGAPYQSLRQSRPRISIGALAAREPVRVMIAEVSLRGLEKALSDLSDDHQIALLIDRRGAPVAAGRALVTVSDVEQLACERARRERAAATHTAPRPDGDEWLAAAAIAPGLGWCAVLSVRAAEAFRASDRLQTDTILWAGVVVALVLLLGLLLSRQLTNPIRVLSATATELARGHYDARASLQQNDELGEFASMLDRMAAEIRSRDREIREWNRELQQRVEIRTQELERAQEQIRRNERMTALASLIAGITHEFNNPLTGIVNLLPLLREQMADRPRVRESLDIAIGEAKRLAGIVKKLRAFVEVETKPDWRRIAVNELIKAVIAEQEPAMAARRIRIEIAPKWPTAEVLGKRPELRQVFEQILANARAAMPSGGSLNVHFGLIGGKAVQARFSDTGIGISPENLGRVFDPFFSKWQTGESTGMGLTLAHRILRSLGGNISIDSDLGGGTRVTVVLPLAPEKAHLL